MIIEVDQSDSWPQSLRDYVIEVTEGLASWEQRDREIEELCQRDLGSRFNPPANAHDDFAAGVAATLDEMLAGHDLLVRHCTRLSDADIEHIETVGVVPLSTTRTTERLVALVGAGAIDPEQFDALARRSIAGETNRRDRSFWIFGRGALRDETGVYRLFRYWGGEAMYWAHEGSKLGSLLKTIGTAAVIEAAIPYSMLNTNWTIGERFRTAIARRETAGFEGTTNATIPASMVRRIVPYGTVEFEELTGAALWLRGEEL